MKQTRFFALLGLFMGLGHVQTARCAAAAPAEQDVLLRMQEQEELYKKKESKWRKQQEEREQEVKREHRAKVQKDLVKAIIDNDVKAARKAVKAGAKPEGYEIVTVTEAMNERAPVFFINTAQMQANPIELALILQRFDFVQLFIDSGFDLSEPSLRLLADIMWLVEGRGLGMPVAHQRYIDTIIKWLIAHGADVNWTDGYNTLLTIAAQCDLPMVVETLLQAGANPDIEPVVEEGTAAQGTAMQGAEAAQPVSRSFRSSISNYSPAVQEVWHNYRAAHRAKVRETFQGEKSQPILPHELVDEINKY